MIRTQIQLDEEMWEALRNKAFRKKQSLSSVIREILRTYNRREFLRQPRSFRNFSFVGSGMSSKKTVSTSEKHDKELAKTLNL